MKGEIVKTYPAKGSLQQFRMSELNAFDCCQCGKSKRSKLVTVRHGDEDELLCNGCYGQLLSEGEE